MRSTDYLIIGGSAAGTTAAETIRNLNSNASITVVSDEGHEFYSRVLIPHYIRGKVERQQIFLRKPQWYTENKIELVKKTKAVKLSSQNHSVDLNSGEQLKYGKLLISIGGYVVPLKIPGSDSKNIFYMRTVEDADGIIKAAKKAKKGVIIGGGFIGLEFTSCFKVNGVEDVTVLVREPYYWAGKLDEASSKVLVNVLEKNGVKVLTNEEVESIQPITRTDPVKAVGLVQTKSGKNFDADVVGVGIGIKSDISWLDKSCVKVDLAIVTNEYLETNVSDIYAAGDCAEFWDVIFKRQHIMGNWANATSQGLAVGKTIAGVRTVFETASSYSADFFDRPRVDTSRSTGTAKSPRVEAGGHCSFIGVTDESFADEVVTRGTVAEGKMTRIFIKEISGTTRIVGATVINNPAEVGPLTMAVKGKIDISVHKGSLADANFDLKNLVS